MHLNAIFVQKLTCVKFTGVFDGIIENIKIMRTTASWEICNRSYIPGLPTAKIVTELPWQPNKNVWNEVNKIL